MAMGMSRVDVSGSSTSAVERLKKYETMMANTVATNKKRREIAEEQICNLKISNIKKTDDRAIASIRKEERAQLMAIGKLHDKKLRLIESETEARTKSILIETELYKSLEADIKEIKLKNNSELLDAQYEYLRKTATRRLDLEQQTNLELAKQGYLITKEMFEGRKAAIVEEYKGKGYYAQKTKKQELKALEEKYKKDVDFAKKYQEQKQKQQGYLDSKNRADDLRKQIFGQGNTLAEREKGVLDLFKATDINTGETVENLKIGLVNMANIMSDFTAKMNNDINEIASKKGAIDTRLQGSTQNKKRFGSYWDRISNDIVGIAGVSPLIKQKDFVNEVEKLINSGISFNVEQRAFLSTISDRIATTFNATDATLLRLVRIQQQDSTAARLGMESSMTAFLNNMYETTEYLEGVASSVRSSIGEAQALMGTKDAVAFEYQVQKWMGSLYSVGMSQQAVSGIAGTLGKLAAGDISGITGGGTGNLLVMAANSAGLELSNILAKGLDESSTNQLLGATVDYLNKMYNNAGDSKVLQQQVAGIYGITASDLKAAANLSSSVEPIFGSYVNYGTAMAQLTNMSDSLYSRTSLGELLGNAMDNFKYTMAAGIANSPILYGTMTIANMLTDLVGGMPLPGVSVLGNMVDLHTSVADLMKVGALSGSIMKGLGQMSRAGKGEGYEGRNGSGGGMSGRGLLRAVGIGTSGEGTIVNRGNGEGLLTSEGPTFSQSGYSGNSNSTDVFKKTMSDASDTSNGQMNSAKEETSDVTNKTIDEHIVNIYKLLQDVVSGASSLHIKSSDFGLSGWSK